MRILVARGQSKCVRRMQVAIEAASSRTELQDYENGILDCDCLQQIAKQEWGAV